ALEELHRLVEPLDDPGLVALAAELLDDTHAHALDAAVPGGLDDRRDRLVDGGRVERVVAGDHLVQQGRVQDRAGAGAALVEGGGEGHHAVAGDRAVGGLDADGAGDGGRLADGAAGVGADGERRLEGGERGRGAAAGAAGDPGEVPGVAGRAVGAVLGGGPHGELVHVG